MTKTDFIPGGGRRRTPRRVFTRKVGVLHKGEYRVEQALQLSEGGFLLSSREPLAVNDHVVVSMIVLGKDCVVVTGTVIYVLPGEDGAQAYGVRFDNIAVLQRRLIRGYVSAKTKEEADCEAREQASHAS